MLIRRRNANNTLLNSITREPFLRRDLKSARNVIRLPRGILEWSDLIWTISAIYEH